MVDEAQGILVNKDASLDEFGKLLDRSWQLKRGLSDKISNSTIDEIYSSALSAGANGGKLMGAGGGGFVIFYVPIERQAEVRAKLSKLTEIDFRFESRGSQIAFYSPSMAIYKKT